MKKRCLIVAIGAGNRVIGDGKNLPNWDLRDDRIFFRDKTVNQSNIMGRINYESLPDGYRPLPNRTNIILTRNPIYQTDTGEDDGVIIEQSFWGALQKAEDAPGNIINIIGGAEIYDLALKNIIFDEVHITTVSGNFTGSVFFPMLPFSLETDYEIIGQQHFTADEKRNSHNFVIMSYKRIVL